jgi:hypothetical protein
LLDEFGGCFRDVKESRQLYGSEIVDLASRLVLVDVEEEVRISLCFAFGHSFAIELFNNAFQIGHRF